MQKMYKNEKCLCSTILSYQRHMSRRQGAHEPPPPPPPPPPPLANFIKLDFLDRSSMHSNNIYFPTHLLIQCMSRHHPKNVSEIESVIGS